MGPKNILPKPKLYFSNNILLFGNFAATPLLYGQISMFLQICPHSTTSTMTFRQTNYTGLTQPYPQPQPGKRTIPAQLELDLQSEHIST